jgi:hypothetical protein
MANNPTLLAHSDSRFAVAVPEGHTDTWKSKNPSKRRRPPTAGGGGALGHREV